MKLEKNFKLTIIINAAVALPIILWTLSLALTDEIAYFLGVYLFNLYLLINTIVIIVCAVRGNNSEIIRACFYSCLFWICILYSSLRIVSIRAEMKNVYHQSQEYKNSKENDRIASYPLTKYGILPDDSYLETNGSVCYRYNRKLATQYYGHTFHPSSIPEDYIKLLQSIVSIYPPAITMLAEHYYSVGNYRKATDLYNMVPHGYSSENMHKIYLRGDVLKPDDIKLYEAQIYESELNELISLAPYGVKPTTVSAWDRDILNIEDKIAKIPAIPSNYEKMIKKYKIAAELSNSKAQSKLGDIYAQYYKPDDYLSEEKRRLFAHNHKIDFETAIMWYTLAAKNGDMHAQLMLGDYYSNGSHVPANDQTAFNWYRLAANQGSMEAQIKLGDYYYYGKYVTKNNDEAFKYYVLAAREEIRRSCKLDNSHVLTMIEKIYNETKKQ